MPTAFALPPLLASCGDYVKFGITPSPLMPERTPTLATLIFEAVVLLRVAAACSGIRRPGPRRLGSGGTGGVKGLPDRGGAGRAPLLCAGLHRPGDRLREVLELRHRRPRPGAAGTPGLAAGPGADLRRCRALRDTGRA